MIQNEFNSNEVEGEYITAHNCIAYAADAPEDCVYGYVPHMPLMWYCQFK